MASGHVNRTQRPNTWLHRPSLRREDSPCQPGAVQTWPIATLTALQKNVGCWGRAEITWPRLFAEDSRCVLDPHFVNDAGHQSAHKAFFR